MLFILTRYKTALKTKLLQSSSSQLSKRLSSGLQCSVWLSFTLFYSYSWASQVALLVKNLPTNAVDIRDSGSMSRLGRSLGGGNGNPLQYTCLENPMDRGAWQATAHRSQRVGHNWSELACKLWLFHYNFNLSSLQWQSWVVAKETIWPENSKVFTIWPIPEKNFHP